MSYLSTRAPGVYVRELPSGNRTIVGGATSITAFVGGAARGPLDTPTSITGFGDYERLFGGLHRDSPMSQAVRHFFINGGGEALIVRVANDGASITLAPDAGLGVAGVVRFEVEVSDVADPTFTLTIRGLDQDGELVAGAEASGPVDISGDPQADIEAIASGDGQMVSATVAAGADMPARGIIGSAPIANGTQQLVLGPVPQAARAHLPPPAAGDALLLSAADPGRWGNRITASINDDDAPTGTFNLVLSELDAAGNAEREETHLGVSADPTHPRYLERILERRSALARVAATPFDTPDNTAAAIAFTGGSDGVPPEPGDLLGSDAEPRTGMYSLRHADLFNLLCLPRTSWDTTVAADLTFWETAMNFVGSERAFLLVDPPDDWATATQAVAGAQAFATRHDNAALFFPRVRAANPLDDGSPAEFPPCGVVAGIIARTDAQRGLWKAPAGIDAVARGIIEPAVQLTDTQQGALNQVGIDAFRTFPVYGTVLWGARTLSGADVLVSDWKYMSIRRLALYLQENLVRGTQWAVFEPNGEALWAELRLSVGGFMQGLFRQGAFAGASKSEAYSVECSAQTTTPEDTARGVVNVVIRFAPLRPAEFVVLKIQQLTAQAS